MQSNELDKSFPEPLQKKTKKSNISVTVSPPPTPIPPPTTFDINVINPLFATIPALTGFPQITLSNNDLSNPYSINDNKNVSQIITRSNRLPTLPDLTMPHHNSDLDIIDTNAQHKIEDLNKQLYHKDDVIHQQKNKIMLLNQTIDKREKQLLLQQNNIEKFQKQKLAKTQKLYKKNILEYINNIIDQKKDDNFLLKIYHQVGMYAQESDKYNKPHISKWRGESDRTLQRQVDDILNVIAFKANKNRDRIWSLIKGIVDKYKWEIRKYLQINNSFNAQETARFATKWKLDTWQMQGIRGELYRKFGVSLLASKARTKLILDEGPLKSGKLCTYNLITKESKEGP
eukprot:233973_1